MILGMRLALRIVGVFPPLILTMIFSRYMFGWQNYFGIFLQLKWMIVFKTRYDTNLSSGFLAVLVMYHGSLCRILE
jgi:hypothetical protein